MIEESQQVGAGPVATVSYGFAANDQATLTYPNGRALDWTYHYPGGLLKEVKDDGAATAIVHYDYLGGRTLLRQSPGGGLDLDFRATAGAAHFDATGRPTNWLFRNPAASGSPTVIGYEWAYDGNGNKMYQRSLHDPLDSQRYAYDSADRLTAFVRGPFDAATPEGYCAASTTTWPSLHAYESWDLDGLGNWSRFATRTTTQTEAAVEQRTDDTFNAYATVGAATLAHDANGNLTRDELGRTLKWDAMNRLREVYTTTGTLIATYTYDTGNRRMRKALGPGARAGASTDYKYAGQQALEESAPTSATPQVQYVYGNSIDEVLVKNENRDGDITCTGEFDARQFMLLTDNYSLAAIYKPGVGVVEAFEFDPYGPAARLTDGNEDSIVNFDDTDIRTSFDLSTPGISFVTLYGGHPVDEETGLIYARNRYYKAEIGRWLSQDLLGIRGGCNLYEYVQSKPGNRIDPYGAWSTNLHQGFTSAWVERIGYPGAAAAAIGAADEAVDHGGTSFWPYFGSQDYHFNRNIHGGTDSRLEHYADHLARAKTECGKNDDPDKAAAELGTALHPYQDWVAHGDYGLADEGQVWTVHNKQSPQRDFGPQTEYPDNIGLDAVNGPNGRPAGSAMISVFTNVGVSTREYAVYQAGTQRFKLTKDMTVSTATDFLSYVKVSGGCKCKWYFGVTKK